MQEPILEALSFNLESDLAIGLNKFGPTPNAPTPTSTSFSDASFSSSFPKSWTIFNEDRSIPCLFPECDFICPPLMEGPSIKNDYLKHLLEKHNFVIDKVDSIGNFYKYAIHWKERFLNNKITDFCVAFIMSQPEPDGKKIEKESNKDEKYYMISDVLPEDKSLREKLWKERLEAVLEISHKERIQTDFHRKCILCKEYIRQNRTYYFRHLELDHSFHIGQPDNVVFIEELLDLLNEKMQKLDCFFCDKTFKDKTVLREHMRKKQHKKINPSITEFDRYYIINYLEPGKSWKVLENEEQDDERREEEWIESKEEETSIVCLLCSFQSRSFDQVLSHMKDSEHNLDFNKLSNNFDFYQKVKVVNFIRRNVYQNICLFCQKRFLERSSLLKHINSHDFLSDFPDQKEWNQAQFFFPTYENDQFLMLLDKEKEEIDEMNIEPIQTIEEIAINLHVIPEDPPLINRAESILNDVY